MSIIGDFLIFIHARKPPEPTLVDIMNGGIHDATRAYLSHRALAEEHQAMADMQMRRIKRLVCDIKAQGSPQVSVIREFVHDQRNKR
jgi:hypothetical protein